MTQSTMATESNISPDDECGVCGSKRDEHGDKNHVFTLDDLLIPLMPGPPARSNAPEERRPKALKAEPQQPDLHLAFATLCEVLAEKDILNSSEIIRIFSGRG